MWDKKIKLNKFRIVSYTDYNNKLLMINVDPKIIKTGCLFYFKNETKYLLPKFVYKKWVVCKLKNVFPSTDSKLDSQWQPSDKGEAYKNTVCYWFEILYSRNTEEEILSNSRLHGFRKVINDNDYFSNIPLINETFHWDNGILSTTRTITSYSLNKDTNKWSDFKINHSTIYGQDPILKMLNDGHEHASR